MAWDQVDYWRAELQREFEIAYEQTTLPERPDYTKVNDFLIYARRSMVER